MTSSHEPSLVEADTLSDDSATPSFGGMALELYVDALARVRMAEPAERKAALGRIAMSEEAFERADQAWSAAIEEEAAGGGDRLVLAFAAALRHKRAELELEAEGGAGGDAPLAPSPAPAPSSPA